MFSEYHMRTSTHSRRAYANLDENVYLESHSNLDSVYLSEYSRFLYCLESVRLILVRHSLLRVTSAFANLSLCPHANPESLPCSQESMIREQRQRLRNLGEKASWVQDTDGTQKLVVMLKRNGTLFTLDMQLHDWVTFIDGTTLTEVLQEEQWPREAGQRELIDEEVVLPPFFKDFPGAETSAYKWPRYGFQTLWQEFVAARASRRQIVLPPLSEIVNLEEEVAAPLGSTANVGAGSPISNVGAATGSASLKVSVSSTWTPTPRMTTTTASGRVGNLGNRSTRSATFTVRARSSSRECSQWPECEQTNDSGDGARTFNGTTAFRSNLGSHCNLDNCCHKPPITSKSTMDAITSRQTVVPPFSRRSWIFSFFWSIHEHVPKLSFSQWLGSRIMQTWSRFSSRSRRTDGRRRATECDDGRRDRRMARRTTSCVFGTIFRASLGRPCDLAYQTDDRSPRTTRLCSRGTPAT